MADKKAKSHRRKKFASVFESRDRNSGSASLRFIVHRCLSQRWFFHIFVFLSFFLFFLLFFHSRAFLFVVFFHSILSARLISRGVRRLTDTTETRFFPSFYYPTFPSYNRQWRIIDHICERVSPERSSIENDRFRIWLAFILWKNAKRREEEANQEIGKQIETLKGVRSFFSSSLRGNMTLRYLILIFR